MKAGVEGQEGGDVALRVDNLRKRFGFRDVLRGVSLSIAAGECCVFTGPNGAGKSTLLRIVATQWVPSSGQVHVGGVDARKRPLEVRRTIGSVFHESVLRPELSLRENLRFYADLFSLAGAELAQRTEDLLERFGLRGRADDRVSTFSQGMTKRANLVRSLLHMPRIWILDEPFAGLDSGGQGTLSEAIARHRDAGGTVLLVSHIRELIDRLATREVRIDDGRALEASAGAVEGAGS